MEFKANSGIWGTMFGVPCIVADNFLKLATGDQIKVLLYILRHSGRSCTDSEIAANTGLTPQQAGEAVMFWHQANVLVQDTPAPVTGNSIMTPPAAPKSEPDVQQPVRQTAVPEHQRQNLSSSEIAELMKNSADIAELFKMAENILGILNHTRQNSLIWMFSYLGLKKEVIITLLAYCASIDKTNAGYIEKIAADWSENEINDLTAAQEEVSRLNESRNYISQIMRTFEMKRRPTSKQMEIISQWKNIGFNIDLIHYAYEKTIERIDKLSFEYINRILLSWRDSGFSTVQDVKNAEADYKKNKKSGSKDSGDDFDVDKYKIFINNF
ncbi:MAG: DnaD domain protein [Ruminococcus sp.]